MLRTRGEAEVNRDVKRTRECEVEEMGRGRREIYKEKCEKKSYVMREKNLEKTSSIIGGSLFTFLATLCSSLFLYFSAF